MKDRRVTNLKVSWVEFQAKGEGIVMEVVGHTEGDKAHQFNVAMGINYLPHVIATLHDALKAKQDELDRVRAALAEART